MTKTLAAMLDDRNNKTYKGRFTRYDFVAYDKLTTGLRHDLEPFSEL